MCVCLLMLVVGGEFLRGKGALPPHKGSGLFCRLKAEPVFGLGPLQ